MLTDSPSKQLSSNQHPQDPQEALTTTRVGLVVLLLCSSFFALYHSNQAFQTDEVWSINAAKVSLTEGIAILRADVHPPLYFQILHFWMRLFGTGERAVRGLSGLFYILSTIALYGLGRKLFGTRAALLCASLYLTSPLAIISAQFARMYSLLSVLSILSTWLYHKFISETQDSKKVFSLYVAVNILGTFTHIAFFFLLFGQIVFYFLWTNRTGIRKFVLAIALSLVPYLVLWAPIVLVQIGISREGIAWVKRPNLSMFADLLLHFGGVFWLLIPILLFVWWRTGFPSLRSSGKPSVIRMSVWLLVITILTPILISFAKPLFNVRLAIVGLHLFSLTVAGLIGKKTNCFLPLLLIVFTAFAMFFYPASSNCDNRTVANYLNQTVNNDDVVIYTSLTRLPIDFYLERTETKKLFETSFPAEIDKHPGYEGRINDPARKPALEDEAQALTEKLESMKASGWKGQIFFISGRYPEIDALVGERLKQKFRVQNGQGFKCTDDSIYFGSLSVYR